MSTLSVLENNNVIYNTLDGCVLYLHCSLGYGMNRFSVPPIYQSYMKCNLTELPRVQTVNKIHCTNTESLVDVLILGDFSTNSQVMYSYSLPTS